MDYITLIVLYFNLLVEVKLGFVPTCPKLIKFLLLLFIYLFKCNPF